jgi:hypothetical protein
MSMKDRSWCCAVPLSMDNRVIVNMLDTHFVFSVSFLIFCFSILFLTSKYLIIYCITKDFNSQFEELEGIYIFHIISYKSLILQNTMTFPSNYD